MATHRPTMTPSSQPQPRVPFRTLGCLLAVAALLSSASAQRSRTPEPEPDPVVVSNAVGTTEVGVLAGAGYRIDIPAAWFENPHRALVVYFHGYSEGVFQYHADGPLNEQTQPIFDRGYAILQSAYSTSGWALAEAYPDTEILRQYFLRKYGQPTEGKKNLKQMETIVAGGSMGGALVVAELELNPKPFAGGVDFCGSVGPTDLAFQRRFAWRAAFDFYFPNLMPSLVPSPPEFQETRALRQRTMEALKANPAAATAMRALMDLHSDRDVADDMLYFTFVVSDLQHRAGGNPFDNRNFLYTDTNPLATANDNALNDGVRRYAADPKARDYLLHHYTPTGRLSRPMLALHTTYDPRIPGATLQVYSEQVAIAGFSENLIQQYVHRDGHCAFTQEEVGRTFDEFIQWIHTGRRPTPGLLPAAVHPAANTSASR